MKVTCLALEPGGGMRPEAEGAAVAGWRAGAGPYWIDLGGGRPEAVTDWLAGLGLDPEIMNLLPISDGETRILPLAEAVYVAYPVPAGEEARKPAHIGFLCLDRLVISMHEQPGGPPGLDLAPVQRPKLREATTAGVVCAFAVVQSGRVRRQVARLRGEGDVLADRMDADPEGVSWRRSWR